MVLFFWRGTAFPFWMVYQLLSLGDKFVVPLCRVEWGKYLSLFSLRRLIGEFIVEELIGYFVFFFNLE